MPENLLALDNGTQSVRALVFDLRGNLLAKQRVPIEPYYSTAPCKCQSSLLTLIRRRAPCAAGRVHPHH